MTTGVGSEPVVLVTGSDRFAVTERFHALRAQLCAGLDVAFGVDDFEGDEPDVAARAVDAARTPAMFGGRRLVVLRHGLSEASIPVLRAYCDAPGDESTLLLVHVKSGSGPKGFTDLVKTVKARGGLVDEVKAPPQKTGDLATFITHDARERGVKLRPEAAAHIASHLGADSGAIAALLDQLAAAYPGASVDRAKVEEFVSGPVVTKAWDLTDALDAGDRAGALERLHGLLAEMHPLQVQAVLSNHVRRILHGHDLAPRTPGDLEAGLGIKPYPAKKLFGKVRSLPAEAAAAAHREVARADVALRGGSGLAAEVVLEVLVARLAGILGGGGGRGANPSARRR